MKLYHITRATIKQFLRDKRSLFLLIGCPLFLILTIFLSFDPQGIQHIPAGISGDDVERTQDYFATKEFEFLDLTVYESQEDCLVALVEYKEYLCIQSTGSEPPEFVLVYDNTREAIILEVMEKTQQGFILIQQQASIELTTELISGVSEREDELARFQEYLSFAATDITQYNQRLVSLRESLQQAHTELVSTLQESDLNAAQATRQFTTIQTSVSDFTQATIEGFADIEQQAQEYEEVPAMQALAQSAAQSQTRVTQQERILLRSLDDMQLRIASQQASSARGYQQARELREIIDELEEAIEELSEHEESLNEQQERLADIQEFLSDFSSLNPESIVNPFTVKNAPAFIPPRTQQLLDESTLLEGDERTQTVLRALNIIPLQTRFPTILLLMVLFLSLLVSSFATLTHINGFAYKRLRTIPHVFVEEVVALTVSSLAILVIPIAIVLGIGQFLFLVPITQHLLAVFAILFLLTLCFVFLGMLLALAIRDESITLVVVTFIFVFLTFYSGFILPTERMSFLAELFANAFPPKIALSAIAQTTLHGQSMSVVFSEIFKLALWAATLFIAAVFVGRSKA